MQFDAARGNSRDLQQGGGASHEYLDGNLKRAQARARALRAAASPRVPSLVTNAPGQELESSDCAARAPSLPETQIRVQWESDLPALSEKACPAGYRPRSAQNDDALMTGFNLQRVRKVTVPFAACPVFARHCLSSSSARQLIEEAASTSAGQLTINQQVISSLAVPDLELQDQRALATHVSAQLAEVENARAAAAAQRRDVAALADSIIYDSVRWHRGRLGHTSCAWRNPRRLSSSKGAARQTSSEI